MHRVWKGITRVSGGVVSQENTRGDRVLFRLGKTKGKEADYIDGGRRSAGDDEVTRLSQ